MNIESTKISDCRVKLSVTATAEETRADYDAVVAKYKKNARIPGFRPGKAPLDVIKRRFGQQFEYDVKSALLERFCGDAVKQEKLEIVAQASVDDVVFAPETGLSFTAVYDIKPQVKLPKYQKLSIKANEIKVDDADVEKQIAQLRAQMSPRKDVEDAVVLEDMVQISYEAKSGRKMLVDVAADADKYAKAEDFWAFASEESAFIPGLSDALIGKKKGEEFTFETKFPKEFHLESLRGVKAKYTGTIKAVRRAELISDEELAKNVNMESVDKIRETIKKHMLDDATATEDKRLKGEISEYLIKKSSFEVPETMVAAYEDGKLEELIRGLGPKADENFAREHADELKKQAHEAAEKAVRLNYVLEAIAGEQKIEVTADELKREVENAAQYFAMRGEKNMTAEKLMRDLYRTGRIVLVKTDLLSNKVLKWMADEIKAAK